MLPFILFQLLFRRTSLHCAVPFARDQHFDDLLSVRDGGRGHQPLRRNVAQHQPALLARQRQRPVLHRLHLLHCFQLLEVRGTPILQGQAALAAFNWPLIKLSALVKARSHLL